MYWYYFKFSSLDILGWPFTLQVPLNGTSNPEGTRYRLFYWVSLGKIDHSSPLHNPYTSAAKLKLENCYGMEGAEDAVRNAQVVGARARNISHNVRCTECGSQSIEDSQADIAILLRKLRFFFGDVGNGAVMVLVVNMIMGRFFSLSLSLCVAVLALCD
ncbi:hypothetical protein RHGRI_024968 [Rhododendron griersonianum]|uniref:Cytochrome c-type biogenesis protein n=1 Tax=Rhododendron griersonianum TaxID=479676 RepID=A0AAV6JEP2_9ERIC|nr:hypothetical protein RHGRI_024968 [Rhododendron griersonianum]